MSGIFGIVQRDGRHIDPQQLNRMSTAMAHRGPDRDDLWAAGRIGLGHRMLLTTPESLNEFLPWKDPLSGLVITADARIDNREELLTDLDLDRSDKARISDSRLILTAYRKWDRNCVRHLLGDFAFAIWDAARGLLFCARDHLGIKPFYYHLGCELFAFASSTPSIVALSQVPKTLNQQRLADYLVQDLEGIDQTCTFYRELYRLPPANLAVLSRDGLDIERYWSPNLDKKIRFRSDREYLEAFDEVLTQAVGARLRCRTRAAISLSGGIDSATVCRLARRELLNNQPGGLASYSLITDQKSQSLESRSICEVVALGGVDAVLVKPSMVGDFASEHAKAFKMFEDPFDSNLFLALTLFIAARDRGDRVMLDGVDADLVVSLTDRYPAFLVRGGEWRRALEEIHGLDRNESFRREPLWRRYLHLIRAVVTPDSIRDIKRRLGASARLKKLIACSPISKELVNAAKLSERIEQYDRQNRNELAPGLTHSHLQRVLNPYLTVAIERYGRVASYVGVENRHPYLDKRLVEFCLGLPWDQKVRNGWSKYLLRKEAATLLPEGLAWRRDHEHLGWDLTVQYIDGNRKSILSALKRNTGRLTRLVDGARLDATCSSFEQGLGSVEENIWNIFHFTNWLNRNDYPIN